MEAIVMDAREMASTYRMTQWAQVLHERKESGQTIKDYCQTRGINKDSYFYWQRKLRKAAFDRLESARVGDQRGSMIPVGFAEIQLQPAGRQGLESSHIQQLGLIVEASGIRLSVGCAYPAEKLAYLLRELVRQC
jgi:hypothetical protein